ncbi:Acyl-CoA dehydrogenase [Desulfatibacillum alkenivorans DSM 16219]|jgi:alkylation response protein AidB-like acyl-CoA dehydrogenase|uniref:Acyl-CoA dehydrogenase n=1 Tax=Desulfatibacillum alkenivorans DSM 16219 TaxID=1121393 RepID=A0A1M6HST2_9BACT|nr:acyl-CoA dehydrogenase family protein [Desulfatibacillum alkenivorans]SHJ25255.1 Acyl-CoA dehydrogenase [Desulfatibacillum alkenivorans DSM 16219]
MSYLDLDLNLSKEDRMLKEAAHEFARDVMRPTAWEMDRMTAEESVGPNSPLWDFKKKAYELDFHTILVPDSYGGMGLSPFQQALVIEELAWGSVGLTVDLAVAAFPSFLASMVPEEDIIEEIILPFCDCKDGKICGCWAITEPMHGSDTLLPFYPSFSDPAIPADCTAAPDGDFYVINGQKAAWVSGAPYATHAALFCQIDSKMGHAGGGIVIVPLHLPGVSRGAPLEKLGQRDDPQSELYFDNVRVPAKYCIVGPDAYEAMLEITLSFTTVLMGVLSVGIGRAAFEEALNYAKTRVQCGKALIEHQDVQKKLFNMFSKVEMMRQMTRAAHVFNQNTSTPAEEYSLICKVHGTQWAFEVCSEAIQIFGATGLTKEYIVEKLFRDARAMMIEDGSNDVLAIAAGHKIIENYPRRD